MRGTKRGRPSPAVLVFLAAEGGLYLWFLWGDQVGTETDLVKYAGILLCLLCSAWGSFLAGGGDRLVTLALAVTLGADTFLLLLDAQYALGVALFCLVQGLYLKRISRENGGRTAWPVRLVLSALALSALYGLGLMTGLNALVMVYIANFGCNVVQSLGLSGLRGRLFSLGLVLFFCCDLCVGAFNQPELVPPALYSFARVGMWLFYLPAQALITLSGLPDRLLGGTVHENQ